MAEMKPIKIKDPYRKLREVRIKPKTRVLSCMAVDCRHHLPGHGDCNLKETTVSSDGVCMWYEDSQSGKGLNRKEGGDG